METQIRNTAIYEEDINLYDYWKLIVKRKNLIIGLFLGATLLTAVVSFLMPKIYREEMVLKLPAQYQQIPGQGLTSKIPGQGLTSRELVSILGGLTGDKIKNILPNTHRQTADIKLNALRDSSDKLMLIVESKSIDALTQIAAELVEYLNNFPIIKRSVEEENQKLVMQLKEIGQVIDYSESLTTTYKKMLDNNKLIPVGFNPIDLKKKVSDLKFEQLTIEQTIKRSRGVEIITSLKYQKPVRPKITTNIIIAGITSIFAGLFLAFFIDYIEKIKSQNKNG